MAPFDAGASSISVAVRVRPFTIREAAQLVKTDDGTVFLGDGSLAAAPTPKLSQKGLRSVIKVVDDKCLVFDPPEDNPVQKFSRSVVPASGKKVKDQVFGFDRIFDDNATQMDVYEGTTKGLLDSVLDGYNATVFAYGATGCGKTHTITGTAQQPGIIFLTMQELFEKIQDRSDEKLTEITLSYLEIYNETIRDLLVPGGSSSKQGLMLREDSNQAVTVAGLTSLRPKNVQEVMDMIVQGNEYRTVSPTEANAVSSRSHAVLQINVAQKDRNASISEPHTMATLSIIDLAGSERASATKNRGERLLEGANINKSLLALGGCINALCDPRKKNHIPYRNSKLTRLLKFSLGGNCKTVMIVCVSPSSAHFDETQNTLRYANRAKNIQTKVTRNVFNVNRHVKDFLVKIDEQMAIINDLKAQQRDAENTFALKIRKQLEKHKAVTNEGIQRIRTAYGNTAADRQQHMEDMKKLSGVEHRIAVLSQLASAFAAAAAQDENHTTFPEHLQAARRSVDGVLAELEQSRQHLHRKMERSHWDRALETALQHSIDQTLNHASQHVAIDTTEAVAHLRQEVELLRANFARAALHEVQEEARAMSFAGNTLHSLFQSTVAMLVSLAEVQALDRERALDRSQEAADQLLQSGLGTLSEILRADFAKPRSRSSNVSAASLMLPPARPGLMASSRRAVRPSLSVRASLSTDVVAALSPTTLSSAPSPRRRKAGSSSRKSITFTPARKRVSMTMSRRSVRWRDDEVEQGTLADFEKTPQKFDESVVSEKAAAADATASSSSEADTDGAAAAEPSSPSQIPLARSADQKGASSPAGGPATRIDRFQSGFLLKPSRPGSQKSLVYGSPRSPSDRASLAALGSSESGARAVRQTPLRNITPMQSSNQQRLTPPSVISSRWSMVPGEHSPTPATDVLASVDENMPPAASQPHRARVPAAAADDASWTIDSQKLRSAIHFAKRTTRPLAVNGSSLTSHSATRRFSVGSSHHHYRGSASYSGPSPLTGFGTGLSRRRRTSDERRRTPSMTGLPVVVEPSDGDGGARKKMRESAHQPQRRGAESSGSGLKRATSVAGLRSSPAERGSSPEELPDASRARRMASTAKEAASS